MPRASSNGITLEYESLGPADRETVLIIAGLGGQLSPASTKLGEAIVARGYRVLAFDNRDIGLSTKFEDAGLPDWAAIYTALAAGAGVPVAYTLEDMAKDAVGLLDALGMNRAHIVGASMGGMIAQLVASDFPGRTLSLTSIMSTSGNPALPVGPAIAMMTPPPSADDLDAVIEHRASFFKLLMSPGFPTDDATLRERISAEVRRCYYPSGLARQQAACLPDADRRAKLQTIKAPAVVVHGDSDPIFPLECGQDTAANIPGAELRVIKGMGHDIPDALIGAIADAIAAAASRVRE